MVQLTSDNVQTLLDCIREMYSNLDSAAFPSHIVSTTSKVIPSCVTSYARISRKKQKIAYKGIASCRKWDKLEAFGSFMHEHPLTNFMHAEQLGPHRFRKDIEKAVQKRYPDFKQSPQTTTARISDVLTDRQFQSLAVFNEFFRPNGVEYQLVIALLPDRNGYTTLSFNRDKRDFSEEERLFLSLIRPHIVQAYKNAESFAKTQQAFAAWEHSSRSMKTHGLTYREEDVLYWVSRGKTNADVARILNIAPGTVKIHLERIYQKLGVDNRTSAAMLAIGDNKKT